MKVHQETKPRLSPGGLVTVAYLKARLDEGGDQLGIFLPLVVDVLSRLPNRNFTTADVQEVLAATHGVTMPQEAVTTLLKRLARKHVLIRDAGRFHLNPDKELPKFNLSGEKSQLHIAQLRLGEGLQRHAEKRGLNLASSEAALDLILRFLEEQQIALLLGALPNEDQAVTISQLECGVVAEFLHDVVRNDQALTAVLQGILEGLVLYHAAFLPDLASVDRHFKDLIVVFDSVLVRQVLGYEGSSPRDLVRETIDLLKSSGVRCVVFDKTVHEIHRILGMYEQKLATFAGRRSLRSVAMARHFLTQRYSPSDVQEMSALLEGEIKASGFDILRTPPRAAESTLGEAKLTERLANPMTKDLEEPRVLHDVDCVAGVLTLRNNHRSSRIEEARAVFATTATLLIRNTNLWWEEDEGESGVPPVVHIRSLVNLAWLKKPTVGSSFQLRELVVLCAAAMRPTQKTWQRFLNHLDSLQTSQRLSEDAVTAIIVSAISDKLLREAELDEDDPDDIDAGTLDEVVERVISQYGAEADKRVQEASYRYEQEIAVVQNDANARASQAEKKALTAAEELRRRDLMVEGRAQKWPGFVVGFFYWLFVVVILVGAVSVAFSHSFAGGMIHVFVGIAVALFVMLEAIGALGHLRSIKATFENRLRQKLRILFAA